MVSISSPFGSGQFAGPKAATPYVPSPGATALALLSASTPANGQAGGLVLSDQSEKTQDVLRTLKQAKQSFVSNSKDAALQKLELARKKLALLRSLGGDPKAVARQAKAIAQEISAAAAQYGAAVEADGGGDAASLAAGSDEATAQGDTAAPAGTDTASASSTATAASSDGTQPTPDVSADAATTAATSQAEASATGSSPASSPATKSTSDAATDASTNTSTSGGSDITRQKTLQAYQDAAKVSPPSNGVSGDQDAVRQFRDAANDAKNLIEEAARKLKAKHPADPDAAGARRAEADLDQSIQQLSDAVQTEQTAAGAPSAADTASVASVSVDTVASAAPVTINILA